VLLADRSRLLAIVALAFLALTRAGSQTIIRGGAKTLRFASPVGIGLFIAVIRSRAERYHRRRSRNAGHPRQPALAGRRCSSLGRTTVTLGSRLAALVPPCFRGMLTTVVIGWLAGP